MGRPTWITIHFRPPTDGSTSRSDWYDLPKMTAIALLSALLVRFPDAMREVAEAHDGDMWHITLRTQQMMPDDFTADFADPLKLAAAAASSPAPDRINRQILISRWAIRAFGHEEATSPRQRALRLLEECVEAFQAVDGDPQLAHKLVDFVFARPKGELRQEIGQIGVCTMLLAEAACVDADRAEVDEIARIESKSPEHFTARNAAKNAAGFITSIGHPTATKEP